MQASRGVWPTGVTGLPYKVVASRNGPSSTMTSNDIIISCHKLPLCGGEGKAKESDITSTNISLPNMAVVSLS